MSLFRPDFDQADSAGGSRYEISTTEPESAERDEVVPTLSIIGATGDFTDTCVVTINNVIVPTVFQGVNRLDATLPSGITDAPGFITVRVRGPLGRSNPYTWAVYYPVPTLETFELDSLDLSGLTVPATAIGTGFTPETSVLISGDVVGSTYLSPTQMSVAVPIEVFDNPGYKPAKIQNPTPGGGLSNTIEFFAPYRPPVLEGISPETGIIARTNINIVATGSLIFTDTVGVIDGVEVPSVYLGGTSISFLVPYSISSVPGVKVITIRNPTIGGGGGDSDPFDFEIVEPSIASIDITEVVQYFDGFDANVSCADVDSYFVVTFNNVAQPTTYASPTVLVASITSAACSVAGTTDVRIKDTLTNISSDPLVFTVTPWTPAQIGSALRWWLDGTSLVDDGSGYASQWSDMSGGSRHISQATSGKRPLLVASSTLLNNKPVARFSSARQDHFPTGVTWLTSGATGIISRTAYNVWAVAVSTSGLSKTIMGDGVGTIFIGELSAGPERISMRDDAGGAVFARPTFTWSGSAPFAFRARKSGGSIHARVNRNAEVSTVHNSGTFSPVNVILGALSTGSGFWNGDIAEVIACNEDLNYTFKAILDNYLSYKYGLPFGSPGAAPTITSISPNSCTQFDAPFVIDVYDTGNSFTTGSIVNITELPLETTFVDAGHLQARIPQRYLLDAVGRAITVADVGGISGPKGLTVLPYTDVAGPNLYSFTPLTGQQYGDAVAGNSVFGIGFTGSSVVYADAIACTTYYVSPTELTFDMPVEGFYPSPGPILTVHDGAYVSNGLELELTTWNPGVIVGVTGWWRADTVVLGSGTDVAQWTDLTGNARHLTQGTVANRPALISSDANFNGEPTLDFDGTNDVLTGPTLGTLLGNSGASTTCGAVFRADAITGTGLITAPWNNNCIIGASTGAYGITLRNTPVCYYYENDGAYQTATNTNVAATTTSQLLATASPQTTGTHNIEINRVAGTSDTYTTWTHGAQIFYVGGNFSQYLNGQIAEVFTATLPLSAQDLICWRNYCTGRYGTP